jgi:UDPglucose 6-dehydrogenase
MERRINVFGVGKVGSVIAALFANHGFVVSGFDPRAEPFMDLLSGKAKSLEPGLEELLRGGSSRIRVNPEINEIDLAEASLVIVPTPSEPSGSYHLGFVASALRSIFTHLKNPKNHLVIIKSTVLPGDIRSLEKMIEAEFGVTPCLVYSPEFIALGDIVKNMTRPNVLLIGSRDSSSADAAEELASTIVQNKPVVHKLAVEEAELAKVGLNAFVTMKISFANLLGAAAARLGSTMSSRVLEAIGSDPRVGHLYLRPGMGFGGPCFPRDNRALSSSLEKLGLPTDLPRSVDDINKFIESSFVEMLSSEVNESRQPSFGKVLIIGASYKVGTPEIEESQPLGIISQLSKRGNSEVHVWDPLVRPEDFLAIAPAAVFHDDFNQVIKTEFDVVFVGLPILDEAELGQVVRSATLINPWM